MRILTHSLCSHGGFSVHPCPGFSIPSGQKHRASTSLCRPRPSSHIRSAIFPLSDASSHLRSLAAMPPLREFVVGGAGTDGGELSSTIATSVSSPLFLELPSKLRDEDLELMSKNLFPDNVSLIQGVLQRTRDLISEIAAGLPFLSEDTVEKVKAFVDSYVNNASDVRIHLDDALAYANGILKSMKDQTDDILRMSFPFSQNLLVSDDILKMSSPFTQTGILVAIIIFAYILIIAVFTGGSSTSLEGNELPVRYDPEAIEAYFQKRPKDIYARLVQVAFEFSSFIIDLIFDKVRGTVKENEKVRAKELVDLITKLGPTSIKIGQALSIRPDILPVAYIEELQTLQDRVPPFPSVEAKKLIINGLGKPVEEIFSDFSSEPVAAASLGQVYKARLKESGETVAVKVQRPGVLEGICRDLYLLRNGAKLLQTIPNVRSNLVALLDNWAFRFFDELDYEREGENALQFAKNMESLPNILVPPVFMQYTSRKVLTSGWVEGEKLSDSKAGDLLQLVKVALNCYLMQLLESGFLHADPHPGNLLRTDNGALCVLDYGLMTQITLEQRYAFIDYISHLVNADYALVAEDLVKLGFVPPDLVDPEKTASVVPQLSRVFGELMQGGGARKVNFQQITEDLSNISRDYVFVLPPYFALILRAFSVLEGIGLAADPDYTILDDCYPYLCKRLITDDSPRTRAALKYFVYAGKDRLDVARAENIISGFKAYQTLTALQSGNANKVQQPSVDLAAKEVLTLMFAPNGSYLQDLLLTELVRIVDALSRDALAEVWQYFASRTFISLPPALLTPKSWPIPLPGLFLGSSKVATLTEEDQESLEAVKRLWVLLEPQFMVQRPTRQEIRETASDVIPLISQLFPGMVNTGQRFVLMLLQRQALRLADDLDGKQSVSEWDKDPSAFARKIRPLISGS